VKRVVIIPILLMLSLLVSVAYLFFPSHGEWGFLFSDMVINPQLWIFYLGEHLQSTILTVVIFILLRWLRLLEVTAAVFMLIHVVDTVDYALTYSEPWFKDKTLSFNTLKTAIFGVSIAFDIVKTLAHGRNTETH
jgi:hypothetical protein